MQAAALPQTEGLTMPRRRRHPPVPFMLSDVLRRLGVNKTQLAEDTGIAYSMICRLERADANPNWTTVVRIARALGISTAEFEPQRQKKRESEH